MQTIKEDAFRLFVADIKHILGVLGILPDAVLFFHADAEAMRLSPSQAEALVSALVAAVGPQVTLVMPTLTAREGRPRPPFNPLTSPSDCGIISETFRQLPGAVRSHHVTYSAAALGPQAQALTKGHRLATGRPSIWGESTFGDTSPWYQMYAQDAWCLCVGVPWPENVWKPFIQSRYVELHQGLTKHTPYPPLDMERVGQILEAEGVAQRFSLGGAPAIAFRVGTAVNRVLRLLDDAPERVLPEERTSFHVWLQSVERIKRGERLQAGLAKFVITPPLDIPRWDARPFRGVYSDLYVRAVTLTTGSTTLAIALCDLLGLTRRYVLKVREIVARRHGLVPDHVMVCCTHSHETPDTVGAGFWDDTYMDMLVRRVADAISLAYSARQPARVGIGRGEARGLARSRRLKMRDGQVFTVRNGMPSTWRVDPALIESEGPIDPDLTILRLESLGGRPIGGLSNYACHPSVALLSPNISGDFLGHSMALMEKIVHGPFLCTNGAHANIDPTGFMPVWGPRDDQMAERLGMLFGGQLLTEWARTDVTDQAILGGWCREVTLPVKDEFIRFMSSPQRLSEEFAQAQTHQPDVAEILRDRVVHTEVQVLRINDLFLVGMPGEVFVEVALTLKRRYAGSRVCVLSEANDYVGYLPTEAAMAEGGYEVGEHLFARLAAETEQITLGAACEGIERLMALQ